MTLARLAEVLVPAAVAGTGLGAFNVFSIEHAEALTAAAEAAGTAVVLQISQNAVRYHKALAPIGLATLALARSAAVPIVVHLDHATEQGLVEEAVRLGFGSVMFDASTMAYQENVPLVLHGSSGVPDHELIRAIEAGMTKINIATHLNQVFTESIRATLAANPTMVDSRKYLGLARDAVAAEAERLLRLLAYPARFEKR